MIPVLIATLIAGAPRVLFVTSSKTCDGAVTESHQLIHRAAADRLRGIFPASETRFEASSRDLDDLSADDGLVFIYYGHGRRIAEKSALCLADGPLPAEDLIRGLQPDRVRWAVLILGACESADVDVSSAKLPLSVISASPEKIAIVPLERGSGSEIEGHFARAIFDALSEASDNNSDGAVTDEEIFEALEAWIATKSATVRLGERDLFPRLRRQGAGHIPVIGDRKYSELPKDQFFLQDDQIHENCRRNPGALDPWWSDICRAAAPVLDPVHTSTLEEAERLAKQSTSAEVYRLGFDRESGWARVERLRDHRLMATVPIGAWQSALPRRESVAMIWPHTGDAILRYRRAVDPAEVRGMKPVVCPQARGQCFFREGSRP